MEVIILAGGLGTRLKGYTNGLPKPMISVAGRPFLEIILDRLLDTGFKEICLAVSYKAEIIKNYFGNNYKGISLNYSIEETPLGTGGAIQQAINHLSGNDIFVLNGDTLVDINYHEMMKFHKKNNAELSIATYRMSNYDRYGTVTSDEQHRISAFIEKQATKEGAINAGTYLIKRSIFDSFSFPEMFSFEADLMEKEVNNLLEYAFLTEGYFIDIGVPEDLQKANRELA